MYMSSLEPFEASVGSLGVMISHVEPPEASQGMVSLPSYLLKDPHVREVLEYQHNVRMR